MIATLAEIKALLQISDTSKDDIIKLNMPIVENFITNHTKNDFIEYSMANRGQPRTYIQSNELQFVNSTNSLDSSTVDLSSYKLAVGDNLKVYDSYHNNKIFTIASISSSSIVFEDVNTVVDENYSEYMTLVRVVYPEDLKKLYSFMINYNISKDSLKGLESETILGYSYKLSPTNKTSYPDSSISELNNYRKLYKRPVFNYNYAGRSNFYGS